MGKTAWIVAIVALTALAFVLDSGCRNGWDLRFCIDAGATINPHTGGEFLLSEVMSLVICLLGALIALMAYIDGNSRGVRVAALFILFFAIAFIGENNMMRDDIRPQFLLVLLLWITTELLMARSFVGIALLALGVFVPALGQMGDHTTQVQFQNFVGMPISDSVIAPIARLFGPLEEPLELAGWSIFVLAAIATLGVRPIASRRNPFMGLALIAITAIAVGNSFLHFPDDHPHQAFRKFGLFCSVAGVAFAGAAAFVRYDWNNSLTRAYCALFIITAYWIAVYAPTVYVHEHSKTISSWLWIFPVLSGFYALVLFRRSYGAIDTSTSLRGNESRLNS